VGKPSYCAYFTIATSVLQTKALWDKELSKYVFCDESFRRTVLRFISAAQTAIRIPAFPH
jgi:hypothetical protein